MLVVSIYITRGTEILNAISTQCMELTSSFSPPYSYNLDLKKEYLFISYVCIKCNLSHVGWVSCVVFGKVDYLRFRFYMQFYVRSDFRLYKKKNNRALHIQVVKILLILSIVYRANALIAILKNETYSFGMSNHLAYRNSSPFFECFQ